MSTQIYYSHGKLLLTGEYLVLDGAKSLAIPTKKGQYLSVTKTNNSKIIWKSFDEQRKVWFESSFLYQNNTIEQVKQDSISNTLAKIIQTAQDLNPSFLTANQGYLVTTRLTFNRQFGLGSSSTLIANIAKWAKVDPYILLKKAFGGSGYDIACSNANSPIIYQIGNDNPLVNPINFNPNFKDHLYFIYLNQKKNSREAIQYYKNLPLTTKEKSIELINKITNNIISCTHLNEYNTLINTHEKIMSELLQTPSIKEQFFSEYEFGSIKSLGAWGGDFILVSTQQESDLDHFKNKGYTTIYKYQDIIL